MPGRLIPAALRALTKRGRITPSDALRRYLDENRIGLPDGRSVLLSAAHKEKLWAALERDYGVPRGTLAEDWEGKTRTEALALASNEKTTRKSVRSERVALKTLKGASVRMDGHDYTLPSGISLDVSASDAPHFAAHACVILVENWEAFERIDRLSFDIPKLLREALVVYRGDAATYPIKAVREFLAALGRPVHVFPDPDPAGLKIAIDFPGYAGLVLPPAEHIAALFAQGRGDAGRYTDQLPVAESALEACTDAAIASYWQVIKDAGRALPQEEFVRDD